MDNKIAAPENRERTLEQDRETAKFVFTRYFHSYGNLKDDLIQEAMIKLWLFRRNGNAYTTAMSGANKVAREAMIDYLRRQRKFDNDISIFTEVEDGLSLVDYIVARDDFSVDFVNLRDLVRSRVAVLGEKAQIVIRMYLEGYTHAAIALRICTRRQYVTAIIRQFRADMAAALGQKTAA